MSDSPLFAPGLPPEGLVHRRVYRLRSRNLVIGVWNEKSLGFIGIREKGDSLYLFTEYEYTLSNGTAKAVRDMEVDVPSAIEMNTGLGTMCSLHLTSCHYQKNELGDKGKWFHQDGTLLEPGASPMGVSNQELFDFLTKYDPIAQAEDGAEMSAYLSENARLDQEEIEGV